MKRLILIPILCIVSVCTFSQTQFWVDDFEGTNSSGGTRTPENNGGVGGPPFTSYFCRTPANGTVSQSVPFTGFQGSNYWAGEDHDAAGTGFANAGTSLVAVREQEITWTGINITGRIGLSLKCLLAANSTNQPFDNRNACSGGATTNTDYVILQYKIDANPYTDLLRFFSNGALTGKYLFQETTGDSCGDGTQLLNVFHEFSGNLVGTGTTLTLRLAVYSEGGNEEWGIDNIRLFNNSIILPVTLVDFSGEKLNAGNRLSWKTSAEKDNSYFEIQRSPTGNETDFTAIGTIKGNGNSASGYNYTFTDNEVSDKTFYYRLKQVDQDGKFTYSRIIRLSGALGDNVRIYPNPVKDIVTVETADMAGIKEIQLVDATGRQLPVTGKRTGSAIEYNLSGLSKGHYFIKLVTTKGVIIKQVSKW